MEAKNRVTDSSGQQLLTDTKIDSYSMIFLYSLQDFIRWWYVRMPIWHLRELKRISLVVDDQLSISLLLKTFFVPWHRDPSFMGILFGIVMRLFVLPITISMYLAIIIGYIAFIIIWFLLPVATITFIISFLFK